MRPLTIAISLLLLASAKPFTTVVEPGQRQSTLLRNAPENFADVAATIADAAGELSGKTIVVKYGGVRSFLLS